MRANDFITEADMSAKILQDPKTSKMLALAMRHDETLPYTELAKLGPRPTEKDYVNLWNVLINDALRNNQYGDLSKDGKFDAWLLRQYINHTADYEDISGEGGDTLGAWRTLSIRGLLDPKDQDFNRFTSLRQLSRVIGDNQDYRTALRRIRDEAMLEKHKRERREVVLIDNDRFRVIIPMNWGACYTFNNQTGHMSNFCTGGSSGLHWFQRYAPSGPIVSVLDKKNANNRFGKWQFHAPTNQMENSTQDYRNRQAGDRDFAKYFPGLMREIVRAMLLKEKEINQASQDIEDGGYDVRQEAKEIINKFPESYKSNSRTAAAEIPQDEPDQAQAQAAPQANQPQAPGQQADEPRSWRLYVSGRNMGTVPQDMTGQQIKNYVTSYARTRRIPAGRVYATDANDTVVRA